MKNLNKKEEVFKRELVKTLLDKGLINQADYLDLIESESGSMVLNYYSVKICEQMEQAPNQKTKNYLKEFYQAVKSGLLAESVGMFVNQDAVLAS